MTGIAFPNRAYGRAESDLTIGSRRSALGGQHKDPAKLLKGSGTKVRHIVLGEARDIGSADVDALIAAALAVAARPIDPKPKRRLIIKSVSAKQRPRR